MSPACIIEDTAYTNPLIIDSRF